MNLIIISNVEHFWPFLRQYNKAGTASIHWCFVTHMCINELTLVQLMTFHRVWHQAITWTNDDLIHTMFYSNHKNVLPNTIHSKMLSTKWRQFCSGIDLLIVCERPPVYKGHLSWKAICLQRPMFMTLQLCSSVLAFHIRNLRQHITSKTFGTGYF